MGAWMAVEGFIGVLFTLIDCAIDIEIAVVDGQIVYGGCGGLAHDIYKTIKNLGSLNPFNKGPPHQPNLPEKNPKEPCQGFVAGPYGDLKDSPTLGTEFTGGKGGQKEKIYALNRERHNGQLTDDVTLQPLLSPSKSMKGVTPDPTEATVDQICPKDLGGDNSYANACVRSRADNRRKSTSAPYTCLPTGE